MHKLLPFQCLLFSRFFLPPPFPSSIYILLTVIMHWGTKLFTLLGFTSGCLVQPVMLNEHTDDADIEALLGTDERARAFKRLTLTSAKVQRNIQNLLPVFDRKGMFD